jgi:hypothetical protein
MVLERADANIFCKTETQLHQAGEPESKWKKTQYTKNIIRDTLNS